jgi:CubicO group peptidase (beta-lactamase class C family)
MKRALFTLLGLGMLLAVLVVGTVIAHLVLIRLSGPGTFEDLRARLQDEIPSLMERHRVPGVAIALVHRGDVAWVRGYGSADATTNAPVTAVTVFQAGSLSKPVSAWGVMRLVEEGKVDLDAPVSRYLTRWRLPVSRFDPAGVTVRRLLSHTAGLSVSGYLGYESDVPLPSLETQLARGPDAAEGQGEVRIAYPPGEEDHYSGGGYTVLQLLIEEVSGQSFATYMQQDVLDPLGMIHSTFEPAPQVIQEAATPYGADGHALPHYRYVSKAAAGLYTAAADLGRFVAAVMSDSSGAPRGRGVLAPGTLDEMLSPAPGATTRMGPITVYSLGLGYQIDPVLLERGVRVVGHDGSNRGWRATFLAVPANGEGIAILTNAERGGALNERVECLWVEWATGSTTPTCLSMHLTRDVAVGTGIWVVVVSMVLGRRILRGRTSASAGHLG